MSAPERIKVWACVEPSCGYWRQEKTTGMHSTTNPTNPTGALVSHALVETEYVLANHEEQA